MLQIVGKGPETMSHFLNGNFVTPHQRKISAIVQSLLEWYPKNARDLPWRRTNDPYGIFVSEIMLQQTQVKTVLPFWERWMRELPTIASAARASSDKIHKLWEGLGYYTRARNLQKAAQTILEKHDGQFPAAFEDILALPGIGRYTAGAISSIAFNVPAPILDGNVVRVLTRIFGIDRDPRDKETNRWLWKLAAGLVENSNGQCSALNQSLMELGALVCLPRNPQCGACPVKKHCIAFKTQRVSELPNIGKRAPATARRFIAFLIEYRGKYLVRQRPEKVVNAHLWEFPNVELNGADLSAAEVFKSQFGFAPSALEHLATVKHSITRYRITLEAFRVTLKAVPRAAQGRWLALRQSDSLAFTSAHRKILEGMKRRQIS